MQSPRMRLFEQRFLELDDVVDLGAHRDVGDALEDELDAPPAPDAPPSAPAPVAKAA